jgi:hypothetical protein
MESTRIALQVGNWAALVLEFSVFWKRYSPE